MNPAIRIILILLGVLMLLPGLCSAVFFVIFATDGPNFFDSEWVGAWLIFAVPGLAVTAGGVILIRHAWNRR